MDEPSPNAPYIPAADVWVDFDRAPVSGRLAERPVAILVGFTGAGKSTTVAAMARRGLITSILPDRRELTDAVILPAMVGPAGGPVTDRAERFALTAAFRERHPGGMGEVLAHLRFHRAPGPGLIAFDGLRGTTEVRAAAALSQAFFIYLDTAVDIRIQRLCQRHDPFDQIVTRPPALSPREQADRSAQVSALLDSYQLDRLLSPAERAALADRLAADEVADADIAKAAMIVTEEARHYDEAETLLALQAVAEDRMLSAPSGRLGPEGVVDRIADALAAWAPGI